MGAPFKGTAAFPSPCRSPRLAVVVVEILEPGDQAEAAEIDLVRARVVADVVRVARAVREIGEARRRPPDAVGDARCSPGARSTWPARIGRSSLRRRRRGRAAGSARARGRPRLRGRRRSPRRRSGSAAAHPPRPRAEPSPVEARSARRPPARASSLQLPPLWSPSTSSTLTTLAGRAPTSGNSGSPSRGFALPRVVAACRPRPRCRRSSRLPPAGGAPTSVRPRVPNASTSRPSSPARSVCASRTRWTMQSPGRTSNAEPSSRQTPEPARTKKISSSAVWRWNGVDHLPGSIRIRFRPTVFVPAADAEVGPRRRRCGRPRPGPSRPRPSGRSHADYVPRQRRA